MDVSSIINNYNNQLQSIERNQCNILSKSCQVISLSRKTLASLKSITINNKFTSSEKEIDFFKNTKQIPLSNLIYYLECYTFEARFPKVCNKIQKKFIEKEEQKIQAFFTRHQDFISYMEQKHTHLDTWYFMRQESDGLKIFNTQDYAYDMEFNTPYDTVLAKLYAYKRYDEFLNLRKVNQNQIKVSEANGKQQYNLKWTATKTALTELIYALYHARVVNNGQTDIQTIAKSLQYIFNFELGDFYKIYAEIRMRKNSQTKFLDELSYRLTSEIEKSEF